MVHKRNYKKNSRKILVHECVVPNFLLLWYLFLFSSTFCSSVIILLLSQTEKLLLQQRANGLCMAASAPFQAGSQLKAVQGYRMDFKTDFLMKSQLLAWVASTSNTEVLRACCTDPLQTLFFFCPAMISVWATAACNSLVKAVHTLLFSWSVRLWKLCILADTGN